MPFQSIPTQVTPSILDLKPLDSIKSLLNTFPPPKSPQIIDKSKAIAQKKLTPKLKNAQLQRKLAKTKPAGFNPNQPFPGLPVVQVKDENIEPVVKTEPPISSGKKLELIGLKFKFYKCQKCDKVFTSQDDRDKHLKTSHFECKGCPQTFSVPVCYEVHSAFGHGPFKCELCPLEFSSFSKREKHRLSHCTSSLIFMCRECGAKFGSHEAVICHRVLYPKCRGKLRRPINREDAKAQEKILDLVRRQVFIYRGPINQTVIVV